MPFQPRVAILTPASDYEENWYSAFARKAAVLTAAGLAIEQRPWTDPGNLSGFDLVLPLFAWGYQRDVARWYTLLDRLEDEGVPVINPVAVLRWNSDKSYLTEIARSGVTVVPTVDVPVLDEHGLAAARLALGSDDLVVKPAISAGADGTHRVPAGTGVPTDALGRRRLVQPLMPGIFTQGEYSLFFFAGVFSHAIVKRPANGDFRVQPQHGGREAAWEPGAEALALAAAALTAAPAPPVYARVDMVGDAVGRLCIIELELIEPALFLHFAPDGGVAFGRAVYAAI